MFFSTNRCGGNTLSISNAFFLNQAGFDLPNMLGAPLYWITRYLSGVVHIYLQVYYPLVYLTDLVISSYDNIYSTKFKIAASFVTVLGCFRSLKLFFPWLRIWPWEKPNSRSQSQQSKPDFDRDDLNSGNYYTKILEEIESTDFALGLTDSEALRRRRIYGLNELRTGSNWFWTTLKYASRADNVLTEVAIFAAALQQDWLTCLAISAPTLLNNGLQLYQQKNADDVVDSLSGDHNLRAAVVRNGKLLEVSAVELVPGDLIHVSQGQAIPADMQIVRLGGGFLAVDQSSITGESIPVDKSTGDICYSTTGVLSGDAFGVVVGTGFETFVGRTVTLVQGSKTLKDGKDDLDNISSNTGAVLWTVVIFLILILFRSNFDLDPTVLQALVSCIVISIYANGKGSLTSMRAVMSAAMAEQGAIVQSLPSINALARIDVLCLDCTGTLAENRLTVMEPSCIDCDVEELILTACLSSPWHVNDAKMDPIDSAILSSLRHYPQARNELVRHKLLDFEPFSADTKQTWSLVESPIGQHVTCIKGSPLACRNTWLADNPDLPGKASIIERYKTAARSFADDGSSSLGILRKHENQPWQLMGLLPLRDNIRWDAASAIKRASDLGVNVKIMTGSSELHALGMIEKLGLDKKTIRLNEHLDEYAQDIIQGTLQNQAIQEAACFCEVSTDDKVRICRTLKHAGHSVAMTGDGSLDAPSLKLADCGVAVEGASEQAQAAADLVFLKPGIAVIIAAVAAARRHFRLTETFLIHRAAVCITLIITVFMYYRMFGKVLHPDYFYLIACIDGQIQVAFLNEQQRDNAPIEKRPAALRVRRLWSIGIPLCIALLAVTWLMLLLPIPHNSGTASRLICLGIVVTSHWSFLLIYTRGNTRRYDLSWYVVPVLLGSQLATAMLCAFAWPISDRPMDIMTASSVRLATASMLATACQCWFIWQD